MPPGPSHSKCCLICVKVTNIYSFDLITIITQIVAEYDHDKEMVADVADRVDELTVDDEPKCEQPYPEGIGIFGNFKSFCKNFLDCKVLTHFSK